MSDFKIATYAQGVVGLKPLSEILSEPIKPFPAPFTPYAKIAGTGFGGAPIKAGLPTATWHFDWLYRDDYAALAEYQGTVYIETDEGAGVFGVYLATLGIEREPEPMQGGTCGPVDLVFVQMEKQ